MKNLLKKLRRNRARKNSRIALIVPRRTYKWTDKDAEWMREVVLKDIRWKKAVTMCHAWLLDRIFNDRVPEDYVRGYQECLYDLNRCQPDPQVDLGMERAPEYMRDDNTIISVQEQDEEDEELTIIPLEE